MKRKLLGIIDATTYHDDLEELLIHRSLAALPFAGRYRIIDFVLSNMVNSGIRSVAIFPKMQYRSLMDHLGSGKNWDLNRKRDGLFFFPSPVVDSNPNRVGSFDLFAANMDYFYRSTQEYAIISNCYTIINMDYKPILEWHHDMHCDITEIHHRDGRSMEMYLIKTSLLIKLIQSRNETGYTCMRDVVQDLHNEYTICRYDYDDYAVMVDSIVSYYDASLNLLKPDVWGNLFVKGQPILTKVKDEPPTKYEKGSLVKNSMIANGCVINGTVENSIISRGVKIGKGAIIKNCIVMQKCQIEEGVHLDTVILDKDVRVEAGTRLSGTVQLPFVVRKGTKQGALMNS
ncbi:sugar phosphate nucleotidyltransferase [Neobacillus niacini]|uniref:sugar phosphate nucleotidyltransferase n=1 Tax=Neobacillus niacini TaxID=86668 RepID=UPI0021CB6C8D|nr:sugar phosphate nucleotidyltransferase [Neobacillus niacini]MCM3767074.1 sugar phosphate nucleotidyltransferase [Neobacillus niacini]